MNPSRELSKSQTLKSQFNKDIYHGRVLPSYHCELWNKIRGFMPSRLRGCVPVQAVYLLSVFFITPTFKQTWVGRRVPVLRVPDKPVSLKPERGSPQIRKGERVAHTTHKVDKFRAVKGCWVKA